MGRGKIKMQSRPFNNKFKYPATINEFENEVKQFRNRTWLHKPLYWEDINE